MMTLDEVVDPETILALAIAAVAGLPPPLFGDRLADADGIHPCRRRAKFVVEVVDRKHVAHAHVVDHIDGLREGLRRGQVGEAV